MPTMAAAIVAKIAVFKATAVGVFLTKTFIGKLLLSSAISALQRAVMAKPRTSGITTEVTQAGATNPCSFVLGTYATAGNLLGPPMSHGAVGKTPNAYLTYVIDLGDIAGQTMNRVMIDGAYVALGAVAHPDYGLPVEGRYSGFAWVKYLDGSQTAVDPMLFDKYGTYPDRPWLADMVGRSICYAILTFRYNRQLFSSLPQCMFEMVGIKLYDPRKDSSVGGAGAHRWATPATWEATANPIVMAYNIKRGISLPELGVWGGQFDAEDLPLASWFSAMNICDLPETLALGGTEPRYRAGYEVTVDMEPAAVLEELFKGSATQVADVGGVWKVRCGGPGLPAYFMTDDDIVITKPQELDPFPGSDSRFNGITATYPDPDVIWEAKPAPPLYNPTWEAEDGGKRSVADLQMPAVPYALQVQRVMKGYIADERRFLRHTLTLPPDAAVLEPLDCLSWTSARNGYAGKLFEVGQLADATLQVLQRVSMREVDPSDMAVPPAYGTTTAPASTALIVAPAQGVPGFAASASSIADSAGTARRPAILIAWDGVEQDGVRAIEYQLRVTATGLIVAKGSIIDVPSASALLDQGLLPATDYEARCRQVADWTTNWTAWTPVTTPNLLVAAPDIAPASIDDSHIESLNASKITAGVMNARHLVVTEVLDMDAADAAFSMGKSGSFDLDADGIYMGRTLDAPGVVGFGLVAGKTVGGVPQYLQITSQGGFQSVNASHYVTSATQPLAVEITTSQTITLPIGSILLDLQLIGGGGGGAGATNNSGLVYLAPADGGATTVQLYDGLTYTGLSWTAAGGLKAAAIHNPDGGYSGQNSTLGTGGVGGWASAGGDGTGFGSGGGGGGGTEKGGDGGFASTPITALNLNISALANPKLVVTVGAGGAGSAGQAGGGAGGAGAPGRMTYRARTLGLVQASVLPLKPTYTGTISKTNGGLLTFPAYGAGLWVLSATGTNLLLDYVETHVSGAQVRLTNGNTATFISDKTPVDLATSATAVTYNYQFYKLGAYV